MHSFSPPPRRPTSLDEEWPRSSVNIWHLLLAGLIIAGAVVYGVRRWKQRQEAPAPPPKEEAGKTAAPTSEKGKKPTKAARKIPTVFVGDTRERVIEVLGKPQGTSLLGEQEFLIYSNGQVIIENNVAVSVELGGARKVGEVKKADTLIILRQDGEIQKQETRSP